MSFGGRFPALVWVLVPPLTPFVSDFTLLGLIFNSEDEEVPESPLGRRFSHSSRASSMSEGRVGDSMAGRPWGFEGIGESIGGKPCRFCLAFRAWPALSDPSSVSVLTFFVGVEISSEDESFFRFSGLAFSDFGAERSALAEPFGLPLFAPFIVGMELVSGEYFEDSGFAVAGGGLGGDQSMPACLLLYAARLIFFLATGG
jgi:hypothetical protein